jgi:hypothetical protein
MPECIFVHITHKYSLLRKVILYKLTFTRIFYSTISIEYWISPLHKTVDGALRMMVGRICSRLFISTCHTVLCYTLKCNWIYYHRKGTTFLKSVYTNPTNGQQYYKIRPAIQNKSKSVRNMAISLEIQLRSQVKYALHSIFTKLTITQ